MKRAVYVSAFVGLISLALMLTRSLPAFAANAKASVTIDPDSGTVEDVFTLQVILTGDLAGGVQAPFFEKTDEFRIEKRGSSSRFSVVNGAQSSELTFTFALFPESKLKPGNYKTPAGYVFIGGQRIKIEPQDLTITANSESSTAKHVRAGGVEFNQILSKREVYAGQQVTYVAEIASSLNLAGATFDDPDFSGFWHESFGKAKETVRSIVNSNVIVHSLREALFPNKPGTLVIPARKMVVEIKVPSRRRVDLGFGVFDDLWDDILPEDFDVVKKNITAEPAAIQVNPLPPAPVPNLEYVPVGTVKVNFSIDKKTVKEGESVNVAIELRSDAYLRPYELGYDPSNSDFKIYADKPAVEASVHGDKIEFKKRFSFAVVPQKPGDLTLPQLKIVSFDPDNAKYNIYDTPQTVLHVTPDPTAAKLSVSGNIPAPTAESARAEEVVPLAEDLLPQHIGRAALYTTRLLPQSIFWACLMIPPVFSLLILAFLRVNESYISNPQKVIRRKAYSKAMDALSRTEENDMDTLANIFRTYLYERLSIPAASLTAREVAERVGEKVKSQDVIEKVREAFVALESFAYSGRIQHIQGASLKNAITDIVTKVEKAG